MKNKQLQEYRTVLDEYTHRSSLIGTAFLIGDGLLYGAFLYGALMLDNVWLRLLCVIGAGTAISSLFVLGHDAVHGVLTASATLNRIYGRLAFLPSLHNYGLWVIAHNKIHHMEPNFKNKNSWSPLSKAEYDGMPLWRRLVERLYRSPAGLGIYYFIKRWWADKFFPTQRMVGQHAPHYWADFAMLLGYLLAFNTGLYVFGGWSGVLFGFVLPFVVWNYLIGFTVLMQHTHPTVPWFCDREQWSRLEGQ